MYKLNPECDDQHILKKKTRGTVLEEADPIKRMKKLPGSTRKPENGLGVQMLERAAHFL